MTGQIIVARYDHRRGCIEGYRLIAQHGPHDFHSWEWNPEVIIHEFNPQVQLWLDDPIIKLGLGVCGPGSRLGMTIMDLHGPGPAHGIRSKIFPALAIKKGREHHSMSLWPPAIIPAVDRVRNNSESKFENHQIRKWSEISEHAFRVRKWIDFGAFITQYGEGVMTFSTLLPESYTPTKEKPYQGVWVGDYSAHGCEFLLVMHRDRSDGTDSIPGERLQTLNPRVLFDDGSSPEFAEPRSMQGASNGVEEDPPECRGRLEAIKLTGDVNVPRGEFTWITEDLGHRGLLRVADEQMFKGARVVRSWGHIAGRGFHNGGWEELYSFPSARSALTDIAPDSYIPSQMILMSTDRLAQYWQVGTARVSPS